MSNTNHTLDNLQQGKFIYLVTNPENKNVDFMFELFMGCADSEEEVRKMHPLLGSEFWDNVRHLDGREGWDVGWDWIEYSDRGDLIVEELGPCTSGRKKGIITYSFNGEIIG